MLVEIFKSMLQVLVACWKRFLRGYYILFSLFFFASLIVATTVVVVVVWCVPPAPPREVKCVACPLAPVMSATSRHLEPGQCERKRKA